MEWGTIVKNLNWTLVFNLVNFALLLAFLRWAARRWLLPWLEGRRQAEEGRLKRVAELQAQAEELRAEREAALASANRRAAAIVARAEAQAQEILRQARQEAHAQAQTILAEADRAAARQRAEAVGSLRAVYAELVVQGAARLLAREVRPEDHTRLLKELTARVDARLLQ